MVMTVEIEPRPPARRSRRTVWTVLVALVVLIAAAAITVVGVALRYAHAAPLTCACGLSWAAPDADHARNVSAGPWQAMVVPARPGHPQTFYVLIMNSSSVTQTVLGPANNDDQTAEPTHLVMARSTGSTTSDLADGSGQHYSSTPTAIAPQGVRWLRYTIDTAAKGLWTKNRKEYWTSLQLRVRTGMFTRTETVDFQGTAFVLAGT